MSQYIEFLKKSQSFDTYILFLLDLGFSVSEVSRMLSMPRPTIYAAIKRQKGLVKKYMDSISGVDINES